MKNRTVPYGYRYENGIIVLHPQESKIVKRICKAYLDGQSLLTIATWLNEEQIEYMPEVIGWNKARLKRIIEDERYLGKEPYPVILDEETHTAMQKIKEQRNTQKNIDRKTDIFQIAVPVKCPICGGRMLRRHDSRYKVQQRWLCENDECKTLIKIADSDLIKAINSILAGITPERIQAIGTSESEPSVAVRRVNNEIARLFDTTEMDKESLRKKLLEGISKRYEDIVNTPYATRKIQAELVGDNSTEGVQRINKTISEIILYTDLTVGIILLNGQFIRKEQTHGTATDG
ncbi:MAG: recombinase family protein [Clostridia bacterium]|nr:recombinase family protein [Clostridia bacterium]